MSDIVYIILAVVLFVIIVILFMYNRLVRLLNRAKKAKSNIEICLKKRFDLIPNLVECVKSYSKYENETLESIISLRNDYNNASNLKMTDVDDMDKRLNKYLAIVESYPELKANEEYLNLQKELSNIEDQLLRARNFYNDAVTVYNTAREVVPSNIIAGIFAFRKLDLFKIENEEEKENIKVSL